MLNKLSKISRSDKEYCFECGKLFSRSEMITSSHPILTRVMRCRKCSAKALNFIGEC